MHHCPSSHVSLTGWNYRVHCYKGLYMSLTFAEVASSDVMFSSEAEKVDLSYKVEGSPALCRSIKNFNKTSIY